MSDNEPKMYGWATTTDGQRLELSPQECAELWAGIEADRKRRVEAMPDERAALLQMMDAYTRLQELGWREAIYCPKDGASFDVIEPGSTGIHRAHYSGEWPNGGWWVEADGDLCPSRPILFRLDHDAEAERKRRLAEVAHAFREARRP